MAFIEQGDFLFAEGGVFDAKKVQEAFSVFTIDLESIAFAWFAKTIGNRIHKVDFAHFCRDFWIFAVKTTRFLPIFFGAIIGDIWKIFKEFCVGNMVAFDEDPNLNFLGFAIDTEADSMELSLLEAAAFEFVFALPDAPTLEEIVFEKAILFGAVFPLFQGRMGVFCSSGNSWYLPWVSLWF